MGDQRPFEGLSPHSLAQDDSLRNKRRYLERVRTIPMKE